MEFGQRIRHLRTELNLSQGVAAEKLSMKQADLNKIESGTTKLKFVDQLAGFVLNVNLPAEKLYSLVTGKEYEKTSAETIELPKNYISQTKLLIKTLTEQVEGLKKDKENLCVKLDKALDIIARATGDTQPQGKQGQDVGEQVGKLKSNTHIPAPP